MAVLLADFHRLAAHHSHRLDLNKNKTRTSGSSPQQRALPIRRAAREEHKLTAVFPTLNLVWKYLQANLQFHI
ncbi:hypothetical protein NC651_027955 [Populus alba x Populus x berolinensis]|nr:hypothetical protein NC651_027955 [Populus alba x Populus x berolinensis]